MLLVSCSTANQLEVGRWSSISTVEMPNASCSLVDQKGSLLLVMNWHWYVERNQSLKALTVSAVFDWKKWDRTAVCGSCWRHHYCNCLFFDPQFLREEKLDTKKMSNSEGHHPVGSRHRSSDGAEWSCVAGLKLKCFGRGRCCPGHRQRQPRLSDQDWSEKTNLRHRIYYYYCCCY